ncbi:MAG: addiction module protein [Ginsengibacter sp.]
MGYDKEELFNLPTKEKLDFVEALWDSIENDFSKISKEEIQFAKERLEVHNQNPSEGIKIEDLKRGKRKIWILNAKR